MEEIISLENWPDLLELEKTFYEKMSYENLLSYMASNNFNNHGAYFTEYQEVIRKYRAICQKLEKEVIFPKVSTPQSWEVDFVDKYVKVKKGTN